MTEFRSEAHAEVVRLRDTGCTLEEIAAQLGCSYQNVQRMLKVACQPKKKGGRVPGLEGENRQSITIRLPRRVVEALLRAVDENATSMTEEVGARLVETLIADRLLTRQEGSDTNSAYVAVSAQLVTDH